MKIFLQKRNNCRFAALKGLFKNLIVDTLSYKTISANTKTVDKQWVLVDADSVPLGRLASIVAIHIRGKHKTNYTPHVDCGDNVIVINAGKVILSGNKWKQKQYIRHTGYPGGQRSLNAEQLNAKGPERLMKMPLEECCPKINWEQLVQKSQSFCGSEHSHEGQKPKTINIKEHI